MSDRLKEIKKRAMAALRKCGRDSVDPHDGHVFGIQARLGDVSVCTSEDVRLYVRVESLNKVAYKERDDGYITVLPSALDAALKNLRIHQTLDDLADA